MLDWLENPESAVILTVAGMALLVVLMVLGILAVLIGQWHAGIYKSAGAQSQLKRQRMKGLLDQSQSLPYLGLDGGHGPGGGRYLLGQRPGVPAYFLLAIAWLPAAICLGVATWMIVTAATEFLVLAAIACVICTLLAAAVSASVFPLQPHRVEVDPCPAAVGDLIKTRLGKQGTSAKSKVHIRLLLVERVRGHVAGIRCWSEDILWDQPFFQSETAPLPEWKYQVVVRIPDDKPGTYLAPGYRLEWMIEVRERDHIERFPLPVVK